MPTLDTGAVTALGATSRWELVDDDSTPHATKRTIPNPKKI